MHASVRQFQSLGLAIVLCFGVVCSPAQSKNQDMKSKAISRQSLTPKTLDDIIAARATDIAKSTAQAKPTPEDLAVLKSIYEAGFELKTHRQKFITAVDDYQRLVAGNASYLDKEQAYYAMGNAAAEELQAVKDFDSAWEPRAAQLNLRYKTIDFEVTNWNAQNHAVIEPILNKPKLFGMSKADLDELKRQLAEHGRHLDAALDALRSAIVASGGDVNGASATPQQ
jgi:hypothetical protein